MRQSLTAYEWVWIIVAASAVPVVALMIWDSYPTRNSFEKASSVLWRDLTPLGVLVLVSIGALVMFTPSFVAYHRNHHHKMAIFALNLLRGWSGVGWGIALVWALTAVRKKEL
jgi:Superinfection immunity protein